MNRLSEYLYNRYSADVLGRLAAHSIECVLILRHFLLHTFAHHRHHERKAYYRGDNAYQSYLPVKNEQQRRKPYRCCGGYRLVGEIVCYECFGRSCGIIHCAAYFAGAVLIEHAERKCHNAAHKRTAHIRLNAERCNMCTHQRADIYKQRADCPRNRSPRDMSNACGVFARYRDADYLPQIIERHKCHKRAHCGENAPDGYQVPMSARVDVYDFHRVKFRVCFQFPYLRFIY